MQCTIPRACAVVTDGCVYVWHVLSNEQSLRTGVHLVLTKVTRHYCVVCVIQETFPESLRYMDVISPIDGYHSDH